MRHMPQICQVSCKRGMKWEDVDNNSTNYMEEKHNIMAASLWWASGPAMHASDAGLVAQCMKESLIERTVGMVGEYWEFSMNIQVRRKKGRQGVGERNSRIRRKKGKKLFWQIWGQSQIWLKMVTRDTFERHDSARCEQWSVLAVELVMFFFLRMVKSWPNWHPFILYSHHQLLPRPLKWFWNSSDHSKQMLKQTLNRA